MSSKNCLKRVFTWTCGCQTEQYNHAPAHRANLGDDCPGKVTIIQTKMFKKHSHLKYPNAKVIPGVEPEKIECQGHRKPEEEAAGGLWAEIPPEEEESGGSGGFSSGDAEWDEVGAGEAGDGMKEDAGW